MAACQDEDGVQYPQFERDEIGLPKREQIGSFTEEPPYVRVERPF